MDKQYPFLKKKKAKKLASDSLKSMIINIRSLVVIKISSILVNSTDNMIISAFKGLKSVGLLSNYTLIVSVLESLLGQVFDSITASVGNLNAEGDFEKSEKFFRVLNLLNFWLFGFAGVGIYVLGNNVIGIWLGKDYLLSSNIVLILAMNFYIKGMQNAVWNYKNTYGLFRYGRYLLVMTAGINLVLSILLGQHIGVAGVLIATSVSRIVTNIWYEPYAVYKYGLHTSVKKYYYSYIKYAIMFVFMLIGTKMISGLYVHMNIDNLLLISIYKLLCVIIIPNMFIILVLFKKEEFKYLRNKIFAVLKMTKGNRA